MKILVAPLNWGLGHASRCVPLIRSFIAEGHEVILGGDGDSLTLLRRHFPQLRYVYLAPLRLRYSAGNRQVWAMLRVLPHLLSWSIKDHALLEAVLKEEHIDRVVSDNRFGLYSDKTECIYMTHQLHIFLPKGWRWLETLAERLHARIYKRYKEVWVPDYEDLSRSLAGDLSHLKGQKDKAQRTIKYIGPLSRFAPYRDVRDANDMRTVVAVLSGLEPQRTILENEIVARYKGTEEQVIIIQGLPGRPNTRFKRGNITMIPYLSDAELVPLLQNAKRIIARSGYSTIMDLHALGLLKKTDPQSFSPDCQIELIPTPGQPEQEYLAQYSLKRANFLCKN